MVNVNDGEMCDKDADKGDESENERCRTRINKKGENEHE